MRDWKKLIIIELVVLLLISSWAVVSQGQQISVTSELSRSESIARQQSADSIIKEREVAEENGELATEKPEESISENVETTQRSTSSSSSESPSISPEIQSEENSKEIKSSLELRQSFTQHVEQSSPTGYQIDKQSVSDETIDATPSEKTESQYFTLLQLQLELPEDVEEGEAFEVVVYVDLQLKSGLDFCRLIPNATVIASWDSNTSYSTDRFGIVTLNAPQVDWNRTYNITAQKHGYLSGTEMITVNNIITPGSYFITSTPSNANVTLDGVYQGVTPIHINNVSYGWHALLIDKPGYQPWSSYHYLSEGETKNFSITLVPLDPPTGSYHIHSTPHNASVFLQVVLNGDWTYQGKTPLYIPHVPVGTHRIMITKGGYETWMSPYHDLEDGETITYNVTLTPANYQVRNVHTNKTFETIQEAIDDNETLPGHTIFVAEGLYYENVLVNKPQLTLIGENPEVTIIDGLYDGDVLQITGGGCNVSGFTIRNSGWQYNHSSEDFEAAVDLESSLNTIENCYIYNTYIGVSSAFANSNTLYNNHLHTNYGCALYLYNTYGTTVINNDFYDNYYGVVAYFETADNRIYHNNFINNSQSIYDLCDNTWDNGYPAGGNYYDDHQNPIDEFCGFEQAIPGSDGILDTPYFFWNSSADRYPLSEENGWENIPQMGGLQILSTPSNATILINQTMVGYTPNLFDSIPAGWYQVTLSLDGYQDWYQWVFVYPNDTTILTVDLIEE